MTRFLLRAAFVLAGGAARAAARAASNAATPSAVTRLG